MTDEILIRSFLDSNFNLKIANATYSLLVDKLNEKSYMEKEIYNYLTEIFGKLDGINDVLSNWVNDKRNLLIKDLNDYLDKLDLAKKSVQLLSQVNKECDIVLYDKLFIISSFEKYYIEKVIEPMISDFMVDKTKELNSSNLVVLIDSKIQGETPLIYQAALDIINEYYYDNVFCYKITDFISNCKVDLGPRNWEITHDLYGKFLLNDLNKFMLDETTYQKSMFKSIFSEWFSGQIIIINEELMKDF